VKAPRLLVDDGALFRGELMAQGSAGSSVGIFPALAAGDPARVPAQLERTAALPTVPQPARPIAAQPTEAIGAKVPERRAPVQPAARQPMPSPAVSDSSARAPSGSSTARRQPMPRVAVAPIAPPVSPVSEEPIRTTRPSAAASLPAASVPPPHRGTNTATGVGRAPSTSAKGEVPAMPGLPRGRSKIRARGAGL
jgi:hypothetical protein